jgi:hypothetical protein
MLALGILRSGLDLSECSAVDSVSEPTPLGMGLTDGGWISEEFVSERRVKKKTCELTWKY